MEPCIYEQPIPRSVRAAPHADDLRQAIASVIPWYHGSINRNISEAILLSNGCEGSYLLRDSQQKKGDFVLSTRSSDSVKHFEIAIDNGGIHFGVAYFRSVDEFLEHFDNIPVLSSTTGRMSGISLNLRYPYPKHVEEPPLYLTIKSHAECGSDFQNADNDCHIASKEGYLTKIGRIHKNWKKRWFVLYKSELKYYKKRGCITRSPKCSLFCNYEPEPYNVRALQERTDQVPLRILNLQNAVEVTEDISTQKCFCFRLVFPQRTFYMVAGSTEDMRSWIETIDWKLDRFRNPGCN